VALRRLPATILAGLVALVSVDLVVWYKVTVAA